VVNKISFFLSFFISFFIYFFLYFFLSFFLSAKAVTAFAASSVQTGWYL